MDALDLFAKINMDISDYESGLDKASSEAKGFGSKLKTGLGTAAKVGAAAIGAVTAGAAMLSKTLVSGANEIATYGDAVDKNSQKMGISAEAYQEWDAVMQHCGASIESLKPSMKTLSLQAQKGNEAFKKLGISEEEIANLSKEDLFGRVISGLQSMEEGTERTAIASQLLGRGATELGALFNTSAEETEKMRQRVHELGGVMSDEGVKAAAKFKDNLQDLKTAISGIKRSIMSETLPAFNDLMDGFTKLLANEEGADEALNSGMDKLNTAISNMAPKIGKLIETILPRLLQFGGTLISKLAEQIPGIISAVAKQIPNIAKQLISTAKTVLPQLINVGAELIKSFADGMDAGEVIDTILDVLDSLANTILDNLPQFIDAGMKILEKLIDGLVSRMPQIVQTVVQIISKFLQTIGEKLPEIIMKGMELIKSLVQGIIQNLPELVRGVVQAIKTFLQTLVDHMPEILQAGIDLLLELVNGLIEALPELVAMIPEIITTITTNLLSPESIEKLLDAGLGMIGKIFEGLLSGDFLGKIGELIGKLGEAVLALGGALLGIGGKIITGIWDGMKKAWDAVDGWLSSVVYGSINNVVGKAEDFAAVTGGIVDANGNLSSKKSTSSGSSDASNFAGSSTYVNIYMNDTATTDAQKKAANRRAMQAALGS